MKRRRLSRMMALAACIGLTPVFLGARCGEEPVELRLAWQEDFDGPAGQSPDPGSWRFDIGTDWGNAQLEYDTDRPQNVSLDGEGHLAITARRESYEGQEYTSGRITTRALFEQAYGRFSARIRLPVGRGIWPAFWLLGSDFETVGWPRCGEIDIMEYRGQEPNVVLGTVHGPGYSGGSSVGGIYRLQGEGFHEDFHIFSIEWSPDRITWLVDDVRFQTVTPENLPRGTEWVFDHPFFLILNVAVGGHFVGPPDASTVFPQTMLVDWVRVYKGDP